MSLWRENLIYFWQTHENAVRGTEYIHWMIHIILEVCLRAKKQINSVCETSKDQKIRTVPCAPNFAGMVSYKRKLTLGVCRWE